MHRRRTRIIAVFTVVLLALVAVFFVPVILDRFIWPRIVITNSDTRPLTDISITGHEDNAARTWRIDDLAPGETRRLSIRARDVVTVQISFTCGGNQHQQSIGTSLTPLEHLELDLHAPPLPAAGANSKANNDP